MIGVESEQGEEQAGCVLGWGEKASLIMGYLCRDAKEVKAARWQVTQTLEGSARMEGTPIEACGSSSGTSLELRWLRVCLPWPRKIPQAACAPPVLKPML